MSREGASDAASSARARSPELQAQFAEILAARDDPRRVVDLLAAYPDDEDVDALLIGADALITLGKLDLAMEAYREVERLSPGHAGAASGVARIAILRTTATLGGASTAPAKKPARATTSPAMGRARVAALAFAAAALGALALAAVRFVAGGVLAWPAWALVATGGVAAAVAFGLERRAPLAWWSGVGFTAGAAVVGVAGAVVAGAVTLAALALPVTALAASAGLAVALWVSRDAARA